VNNTANAAPALHSASSPSYRLCLVQRSHGVRRGCADRFFEEHCPSWEIEETIAEKTHPQDLLSGDVLLLASSTWNTGGTEGQLIHTWGFAPRQGETLDLGGKPCACIGLGTTDTSTRRERRIICSTTLRPIMVG